MAKTTFRDLFRKCTYGDLGGITGGLLFGPIMAIWGILPLVAKLIGQQEEWIGFLVHMGISTLFGWWFGLLAVGLGGASSGMKRATGLGLAWGFLWWILGGLTLMPAFLGMPPQFSNAISTMNLASLLGHLVYGLALGAVYGYLDHVGFMQHREEPAPVAAPPPRLVPPRAR